MKSRLIAVLMAAVTAVLAAPTGARAEDPSVARQWGLVGGEGVGARAAWSQSLGAGVVVAVLDSGIELDHPDLKANLWTNPGEVPGNGVDDDRSGYVDDVHGANVIGGGGRPYDDNGHGTHVAGIVAAAGDNAIGGSGVAPRAQIMAVKVLDARNAGTTTTLAAGIRYALDQGAKILNVSINGDGQDSELDAAIDEADRAGATVVASAGNNARDIDASPSFPTSLVAPNVLGVTAIDRDGNRWEQANHGPRSVDLAAPGVDVLSTALGSRYEERTGTSMAAPHVAGALALLGAARPDLATSRWRDALLTGARRTRRLTGFVATGALDVPAGLRVLSDPLAAVAAPARLPLRAARSVRRGRATVRWRVPRGQHVTRWRVSLDGRLVARVTGSRALRVGARVRPGRHRWAVTGFNARRRVVAGHARFRALR